MVSENATGRFGIFENAVAVPVLPPERPETTDERDPGCESAWGMSGMCHRLSAGVAYVQFLTP